MMKRENNHIAKLRKIKIKNRLIIAFIMVSIIPIILISTICYRKYAYALIEKVQESMEQNLKLVNQNIDKEVLKYQSLLDLVMMEESIQKELVRESDIQPSEKNYIHNMIDKVMLDKGIYSAYIKNIVILDNYNEVFFELGYDGIDRQKIDDILNQINHKAPLFYWDYVKTYKGWSSIVMGRSLFKADFSQQVLGQMLIFFNERLFNDLIFKNVEMIQGMSLFLMNTEGVIISSSDSQMKVGERCPEAVWSKIENRASKEEKMARQIAQKEDLVCYIYNELTDWWLVLTVPFEYINSESVEINKSIKGIVMPLIIACMLISGIIYKSIMDPIKQMIQVCQQVSTEELQIRMENRGNDEISYLTGHFNKMLDEIQELVEIQKSDSKKKRELEIQMLQYQINPHFLFNTLGTLRWMALINQDDVVGEGITALSELLKGTLVNKNEYVSIKEEIDNLNNYFAIQKLRYANSFEVDYEIEENLLDKRILKFILQPIPENSIIHGIQDYMGKVTITIRVGIEEQDRITIYIEDNGSGFEMEKNERQINTSKLTGIGVKNVEERIKLAFGEEYGVVIQSTVGKGTQTKIVIPKLEETFEGNK